MGLYANCGFSVAYTYSERERIVDVLFGGVQGHFWILPTCFWLMGV